MLQRFFYAVMLLWPHTGRAPKVMPAGHYRPINTMNLVDDFIHWTTQFRMLKTKQNEQFQNRELLLFIATAAQCP
mgnify:CR=1 FL=1